MRTALKLLVATTVALAGSLFACTATAADAASDYPKRTVKMLMPNAVGSSNDILGRLLSAKLGEVLGQPVYVENQPGAGGLIAMEMAKKAAPDGYTIVSASAAGLSIAPNMHERLPYDPLNDFQFISLYAVLPNVLVVTPALPIKTVEDLIEYTKSHPGRVNMASAGPGSQSHLAGVKMQMMGHFSSVHIPYKGGGASVVSVMTGETQWTITPASSVIGHVRSGKLRALAQSLPQRSLLLPDMPAVGETIKGFSYSGWNGIIVPKATPAPIVEKIRAALLKTLMLPEVRDALNRQGAEVVTNTAEEFHNLVQTEIESTARVFKTAGLKAE